MPTMNRVKEFLQKEYSAPIAFFILCILGFGVLTPTLGFYMDDWPYIFYAKLKDIDSLREMLTYDSRPNAAWLYISAFRIFGFNPIVWHVFALLMRTGTVIAFWFFLKILWNEQKQKAVMTALLFAIFPFFMLQPFAVGSTHHWFGFLAFQVSLILMVYATQVSGLKKWLYITPALLLEVAHLFTSEYFAGLELIRILVLWILISRKETEWRKNLRLTLLTWLPYFFILGLFFYWRIIIYQSPEGVTRNEPVILMQLLSEPFKAILFLINAFLADTISVLTIGWSKATDASLLRLTSPFVLFKFFICGVTFSLTHLYLRNLLPKSNHEDHQKWKKESLSLAAFALITGGLPIWFIGRSIVESKNLLSASRFGIPAMFGASILTFFILDYFITDKNKKNVILACLLALAVNFHLDNTKEFQYSWEKQERFAQQLIWRAPSIQPGTAILTDQEVMGMMGEYAVSFSINTTYQVNDFENTPPYWYFPFYYTNPNVDDLLQGVSLEYSKLTMNFNGNSTQMILLDFNPELQRCLWVLQPQDSNLRLVSDDVRKLATGSDINLIKQAETEPTLPEDIYGKVDTQTWCYYFEKADLARQYSQWDEIVRLWDEAQAVGERPDNGFEYIPFIEGWGHTGNWEQVKETTKFAKRISAGLEPSLCSAMDRLAENAPASQEKDETIQNLKEDLDCGAYQ